MDASGVNDVMKFVHRLLRAIVKVAVLNDTLGSVEALVGPNSYRGVKKRFDFFYFTLLFFTTKLCHEVSGTLFGGAMGLRAQNLHEFFLNFERCVRGPPSEGCKE